MTRENIDKIIKGDWIENQGFYDWDKFYICSNCGIIINPAPWETLEDYPLCECGADMTKGAE